MTPLPHITQSKSSHLRPTLVRSFLVYVRATAESNNSLAGFPGSGTWMGVMYLGVGMDWRVPSWQGSLGKYHSWLERGDMESWEKWKRSHPRCAAVERTPERWRLGACAARCGWDCETVQANCAVDWTRCVAVQGQEAALEGRKKDKGDKDIFIWHIKIIKIKLNVKKFPLYQTIAKRPFLL